MERLDDLIIGNYKIFQETEEFCFSIDAVLLSHFARYRSDGVYADLGTGTGAIALIASALGAGHVTGFEFNPITCGLAKKSVLYNGLENRVQIVEADYRHLPREYEGAFDGILINPPYFPKGRGKDCQRKSRQIALHEEESQLSEIIYSAKKLLRYSGVLWMIHRSEFLVDILHTLHGAKLEPKRLRFVHSSAGVPSKLVLLEAKYGGKSGIIIDSPLYIHEGGAYSPEVQQWYEKR